MSAPDDHFRNGGLKKGQILRRTSRIRKVKDIRPGVAGGPLFAAAADPNSARREVIEPPVMLRPMAAGRELVEDYSHTGRSLRRHPVAFQREDLTRRRIVSCAESKSLRDRHWCEVAGLVLVRQRPGSAKGAMFITLEDETDIANLVV